MSSYIVHHFNKELRKETFRKNQTMKKTDEPEEIYIYSLIAWNAEKLTLSTVYNAVYYMC